MLSNANVFCSWNSASLSTPGSRNCCISLSCEIYEPLRLALLAGDTPMGAGEVTGRALGWGEIALANVIIASVRVSFLRDVLMPPRKRGVLHQD